MCISSSFPLSSANPNGEWRMGHFFMHDPPVCLLSYIYIYIYKMHPGHVSRLDWCFRAMEDSIPACYSAPSPPHLTAVSSELSTRGLCYQTHSLSVVGPSNWALHHLMCAELTLVDPKTLMSPLAKGPSPPLAAKAWQRHFWSPSSTSLRIRKKATAEFIFPLMQIFPLIWEVRKM